MTDYNMGSGGFFVDGVPITGQGIPATFGNTANKGGGKTYFVNPTTGSDGNSGLSMAKPFATLDKFNTIAISDNHDVCVMSATSAHAQTEELTVTNNRTHFVGLDAVGRYYGQRTRVTMGVTTTAGTIAIVKNTGVGNTFTNMKFDSADTLSTSVYAFADGGEYTVLANCEIYKSTDLDQAAAAELLCNGDSSYYVNCTIGSNVAITDSGGAGSIQRPGVLLSRETISGKVARDVTFENCIFWKNAGHVDVRYLYGSGATDVERMLLLKNCTFFNTKLAGALPAVVIGFGSTQTEGYVLAQDCTYINVTKLGADADVYVTGAVPTHSTSGKAVVTS